MDSEGTNEPSYTERKGKPCPSCGWEIEIVTTFKDGTETAACANCFLDKTPRKSDEMTLKEIESRKKNFDYKEFLEDSEAMKDLNVKISSFELERDFSIRVGLILGKDFLNMSPKDIEPLIRGLSSFPKTQVQKNETDSQRYKLVRAVQCSNKSLEVKLILYKMENTVLKELPTQIRSVWSDLLDKI